MAAENQPATLVEVGHAAAPMAEPFASKLQALEGKPLQVEQAPTGISKNLFLEEPNGTKIGVFRRMDVDGAVEAEVMLFDTEGFFDLVPAVKVTLKVGDEKLEGYLQEFETSHPSPNPKVTSSIVQQIQKIGILDILLINEDRHGRNILLKEGQLVPIDHNLSLLSSDPEHVGLDIPERLDEAPFWEPVIPVFYNTPFWFSQEGHLSQFAQKAWSPVSRAFVEHWNPDKVDQQLKERFGVNEGTLMLIKAASLWLKKGVEAGLTLQQLAEPIFTNKNIFVDIYQLAKSARFEDIEEYAGLEYDMLEAVELTRLQVNSGSHSNPNDLFLANLNKLYNRRIALIKGTLTPAQRDEYRAEIWMNLFLRDELTEWLRGKKDLPREKLRMISCHEALQEQGKEAEAEIPLPCTVDALELTKQLTQQRFQREWGSAPAALRDSPEHAFFVHYDYFSTLDSAVPGTDEYLRMAQFLLLQIERFDELMVPGVIWTAKQNREMSRMPIEDVIVAIKLAKAKARLEGAYYRENIAKPWEALAVPQFIDGALGQMQDLREQFNQGRITQSEFDQEVAHSLKFPSDN